MPETATPFANLLKVVDAGSAGSATPFASLLDAESGGGRNRLIDLWGRAASRGSETTKGVLGYVTTHKQEIAFGGLAGWGTKEVIKQGLVALSGPEGMLAAAVVGGGTGAVRAVIREYYAQRSASKELVNLEENATNEARREELKRKLENRGRQIAIAAGKGALAGAAGALVFNGLIEAIPSEWKQEAANIAKNAAKSVLGGGVDLANKFSEMRTAFNSSAAATTTATPTPTEIPTATATPTESPVPAVTATSTESPTSTATQTAVAVAPTSTPTTVLTEAPSPTATATTTPTATEVSPTATQTAVAPATPEAGAAQPPAAPTAPTAGTAAPAPASVAPGPDFDKINAMYAIDSQQEAQAAAARAAEATRAIPANIDSYFSTHSVHVDPGRSFWSSFELPDEFFPNNTPWVNPENGVTQMDVVRDMVRQFASANGHQLEQIQPGDIDLDKLELTDEQKRVIAETLKTTNAKDYIKNVWPLFRNTISHK